MVTVQRMSHPLSQDEAQRGGRLISTNGQALPLLETRLHVEAGGGLARTVVIQRFANSGSAPLKVHYLLPLPSDGAVSGFTFTLAGERVQGKVQSKEHARRTFEAALSSGHTATLLEQERDSVFTQEVGNLPPGEELTVEVSVDQPLLWRHEGLWEWRFPTVVGARYQGATGRVSDASRTAVDVADRPLPVTTHLAMTLNDQLEEGGVVESPSHRIKVRGRELRLAKDARLDRDVVIRWPVMAPDVGVGLQAARPDGHGSAYGLLTLVPPEAADRVHKRELVLLLDTSGSMHGEPLQQCQRVAAALIDSLADGDTLEVVEFSSRPTAYREASTIMNSDERLAAIAWVESLEAGGGTEMASGIKAALKAARRGSQKQIVLMTDGYVGFETEIVRHMQEGLPTGARMHTVGVGNAVNRTLTRGAARAGRGLEVIIGCGEDAERACGELVARTAQPVLTDLVISGSAVRSSPPRPPDLYARAPVKLAFELDPAGGTIEVRALAADGEYVHTLEMAPIAQGVGLGAVPTLYARERVAELELSRCAGLPSGEVDPEIEAIGLKFQIATRRTSWVAVTQRVTVDPGTPLEVVRMPHEMVAGVSAAHQGLGRATPSGGRARMQAPPAASAPERRSRLKAKSAPPQPTVGRVAFGESDEDDGFFDDVSVVDGEGQEESGEAEILSVLGGAEGFEEDLLLEEEVRPLGREVLTRRSSSIHADEEPDIAEEQAPAPAKRPLMPVRRASTPASGGPKAPSRAREEREQGDVAKKKVPKTQAAAPQSRVPADAIGASAEPEEAAAAQVPVKVKVRKPVKRQLKLLLAMVVLIVIVLLLGLWLGRATAQTSVKSEAPTELKAQATETTQR